MQLLGIDYIIVGMVVLQCGILLFVLFEGNVLVLVFSFFLQNICFGDILKNFGYENYFVQGVNLCFVGKDVFFKFYGFDYLYGVEELKIMVVDFIYCNDWGFYDDIVFDEIWKKFEELLQFGKCFLFFVLMVDIYYFDGFILCICECKCYDVDGKKNFFFSVVSCSQEYIVVLIEKIKVLFYFKNMVIVVFFDYLVMKNSVWDYFNKYDCSNLFFVLCGDKLQQEILVVKCNIMDNGVMVLDIFGGDNYIGFGCSSFFGQLFFGIFMNMKEKVLVWKFDVICLWNFFKEMKNFIIDL